jgi:hypothetical protein
MIVNRHFQSRALAVHSAYSTALPLVSVAARWRIFKLARTSVLCLAAVYAGTVAVNAARYTGPGLPILTFAAQSLKADAFDMLSVMRYRTFGTSFGAGTRPTRYALICREVGKTGEAIVSETENAANESRVRRSLVEFKGGSAYNQMMEQFDLGRTQPIFILSSRYPGGANICASFTYWTQSCSCYGKYQAAERSRIPARDIFGPPKPLH